MDVTPAGEPTTHLRCTMMICTNLIDGIKHCLRDAGLIEVVDDFPRITISVGDDDPDAGTFQLEISHTIYNMQLTVIEEMESSNTEYRCSEPGLIARECTLNDIMSCYPKTKKFQFFITHPAMEVTNAYSPHKIVVHLPEDLTVHFVPNPSRRLIL